MQDIIPLSAITLFVGFAGDGKSYFTTRLSAMVSKSGNYFRNQPVPTGKVFICNSEDNAANTILPRLQLNGADTNNVANIDSVERTTRTKGGTIETYQDMITLNDITLVRNMCEENPTCKLIIFDLLSAFWGEYNENKGPDVRIIMSKLKKLAETYNIAVVLVTVETV